LNGEGWLHGADYRRLQEIGALESVAALRLFFGIMTGVGDPQEVIGYGATPNFFEVTDVPPALGRVFTEAPADADTVVLGHAFWQRRFDGDAGVLGRRLRLGDRELTVVGVMARDAEFPMGTDLWVPLALTPEESASFTTPSLRTIGRLAPGATHARLRDELAPLAEAASVVAADSHRDTRIEAEPILANITLWTRPALAFLMGAAAFLLLLVCGNVANMQLAQAAPVHRRTQVYSV
jgi:hypothetical protein